MKNVYPPIGRLIFALMVFMVLSGLSKGQTTTVWIVRHAEKDVSNPQNPDPALSSVGQKRVEDLAKYFAKLKPDVIFSTIYKRTRATAAGLSSEIKPYNAKYLKELANAILLDYKGKNVLIVGHSNTLLETIEAFGDKRPIPDLTDDDYDYLFKLTISKGKIKTEVLRYGEQHRDTGAGAKMKNE